MASRVSPQQVVEALDRVPARELPTLLRQLSALGAAPPSAAEGGRNPYLELLRREDASGPLKVAVGLARRCTAAATTGEDERRAWKDRVETRMRAGLTVGRTTPSAPDAERPGSPPTLMPELAAGRFVQLAHETMLGRGCQPHELVRWRDRLDRGEVTREGLLEALQDEARRVAERDAARQLDPETGFHVMGTGRRITAQDWQTRAQALAGTPAGPPAPAPTASPRLRLGGPPRVRISAITSLYAGGAHIERFLDHMVAQTVFADRAELIIVDAHSPDAEQPVIERYQRRWPNIRYLRTNERIGIYEAWNLALGMARGEFLTSANVDDLRRADSLEQQAALLELLPFVDVVYQDFYYTLDPTLGFDEAAAFGFRSDLPLVTPQGLMALNPPHNAPMWRRRLHDELGLFDTGFQSAGDYDFWMRCVLAGKTFYKLNDPHVVYFQNPHGLSTRPDTRGHEETREVHRRYGRQLVSENLVIPLAEFRSRCGEEASPPDMRIATADRQTLVHRALLTCARSAPWPAADPIDPSVPPATERRLRLLIDGIALTGASARGPAWTRLAAELAADVQVDLWWLDRGLDGPYAPVDAGRRIPFPRHHRGACAADSLLIQKVCDLHEIDVFVSTGSTTPVATPMLGIVGDGGLDAGEANTDPAAPARRERELAWAFARGFVGTSPAALGQLRRQRPALPPGALRMAEGNRAAPSPALLLRQAGRELRAQRQRGTFDSFFAEWRRLRELQASVDF